MEDTTFYYRGGELSENKLTSQIQPRKLLDIFYSHEPSRRSRIVLDTIQFRSNVSSACLSYGIPELEFQRPTLPFDGCSASGLPVYYCVSRQGAVYCFKTTFIQIKWRPFILIITARFALGIVFLAATLKTQYKWRAGFLQPQTFIVEHSSVRCRRANIAQVNVVFFTPRPVGPEGVLSSPSCAAAYKHSTPPVTFFYPRSRS